MLGTRGTGKSHDEDFHKLMKEFQEAISSICKVCNGSGQVPMMQMMAREGKGPVRGPDTLVTCPCCRGTGRVERRDNQNG